MVGVSTEVISVVGPCYTIHGVKHGQGKSSLMLRGPCEMMEANMALYFLVDS